MKRTSILWPFYASSSSASYPSAASSAPSSLTSTSPSYIDNISKRHSIQLAKVTEVHPLSSLSKMRYKKDVDEGVLLMHYKNGSVSRYVMKNVGIFAEYVKRRMKEAGLSNEMTKTQEHEKFVLGASLCFDRMKDLEKQFSFEPKYEYIQEMMTLFRKGI